MPLAKGSVNVFLKLSRLSFMAPDQLFFYFLGLLLVLGHFLVPVVIELSDFLNMGHLDLLFFFLVLRQHILSFAFLQLCPHFSESFFRQICFYILACHLALLLMSVQYLSWINWIATCIDQYRLLRTLGYCSSRVCFPYPSVILSFVQTCFCCRL